MGLGRDMYDQHLMDEHSRSKKPLDTRANAHRLAINLANSDCGDFPDATLVKMVRKNRRRGRKLLILHKITYLLPWFIAKRILWLIGR